VTTTKKAFDLSRDSVYVADPITELRIIGGKGLLADDEAGALDTEPDAAHPVADLRRLKKALPAEFKANVAFRGVDTPIRIAKIDDIATVVEGKSRVRAARAANRERKKRGEPLIRVRCVMQRETSDTALRASIISGNNARMEDDFSDKLEKLKALLASGASEDDAALYFMVKPATIRGWLAFEDGATAETKAAVKEGRIGASVAAELARVKDADEQRSKLGELLAAPEPKARGVRAAKLVRGAKHGAAFSGKKPQMKLLGYVQSMSHSTKSDRTIAFWEGVEETLKLVLGEKDADERLTKAVKEALAAAAEAKAKPKATKKAA